MSIDNESPLEKTIIWFASLLILVLLPLSVLYFWQETFDLSAPVNDGKFGTFGDFVGGVLGSIWSLCGVILFYLALKEQRKDFRNNNKALLKQIEALEMQGQEFKLQRNEMELARTVSREQSKIIRSQRLDATYFSLIGLYKKTISELDLKDSGGNYFKSLKASIQEERSLENDPKEKHCSIKSRYSDEYFTRTEELSHYFKTVYRVIKIVDEAEISEIEKFRYIKIMRSQLSENELLALYYNSHSDFGGEFYKLILKYNFLKHLPCTSKVEFSHYLHLPLTTTTPEYSNLDINKKAYSLHVFCNEVTKILRVFQTTLKHKINDDDFEALKISNVIPLFEDYVISLISSEYNELSVQISRQDRGSVQSISLLERAKFECFFCDFLYDTYWFSKYIQFNREAELVSVSGDEFKVKFDLKSPKKLLLNSDLE